VSKERVLIANRGEIAIRISRAVMDMGMESVAIYSKEDGNSLHIKKSDQACALPGAGAGAYLDQEALIRIASEQNCKYVHPGYGFLSENADFAALCEDSGLVFVGPSIETLHLFGNKVAARALAKQYDVPLIEGSTDPVTVNEAKQFFSSLGPGGAMLIKAVSGGGGRGMRIVLSEEEIESAYERCKSEALKAFGDGDLYVERLVRRAQHIEVQIVGDGLGSVIHLGERECSIQRRHQKVIEIAPSPSLTAPLRELLIDAALRLAKAQNYRSLGTFEFLIDEEASSGAPGFAFIEANPRLQVEHTVTEEVMDQDLVRIQLEIARGKTLKGLGLLDGDVSKPKRSAMQLRVNMETMSPDGEARPAGGYIDRFEPPTGPATRVDTFGYAGYQTNPAFDSLLAKVIVSSARDDFPSLINKAYRTLCEFKIAGVPTNLGFLQNILRHPKFEANNLYTRFVDDNLAELVASGDHHNYYFETPSQTQPTTGRDTALLKSAASHIADAPEGSEPIVAPMQGTVLSLEVETGSSIAKGEPIAIMEAMKMEHVIAASQSGTVCTLAVNPGDTIYEGEPLVFIQPGDVAFKALAEDLELDLEHIRSDLFELQERRKLTADEARPHAVEKRHKKGFRTARENIADLVDDGTFHEYGALVIAPQRRRREIEDLIKETPADGLISGVCEINGNLFGPETSKSVILSYDYTVMAGTQGGAGHIKTDRIIEVARKQKLPLVFFTEGGGGRPGDTDIFSLGGMHADTFALFAELSGLVPLVGVNSGWCFAGNASFLGCCDVIIATENSSIGMGGPAMIEGGNLGIFRPEEVGPVSVQSPNGVIDILVKDEIEAVASAKKYLSYFQGNFENWTCRDQRKLRHVVPENRKRIYDIRDVVNTMADDDSVLELRRDFGLGMVTAFVRFAGRPVGIIANNPSHLAGAIDSDAANKAAHFMQLCDAFDIPIVTLIDTPGIMVGPEAEKTATVRHANRLMITGANISVPVFSIVLRKSYGLGAYAMVCGSFNKPVFSITWPTGEFGGMGLEGYVRLGFRKELDAIKDPVEQKATFDEMVEQQYARGRALNVATFTELDDVIDPAESRNWIISGLESAPSPKRRDGKKRPMVDVW
jgi:acetyl/propionyl-CoA carboxylase alpha subunit/acetyl-CoA carboxylase carboxyltransferase component